MFKVDQSIVGAIMPRWWYKFRHFPARIKARLLEDGYERGLGGPPNNWQHSQHFESRQRGSSTGHEWWSIHFGNDAFDVQIATKYSEENRERWALFLAAEDFRKMAIWYLWRWAWGEWFGLRRRLFYWDLHRRVKKMDNERQCPIN